MGCSYRASWLACLWDRKFFMLMVAISWRTWGSHPEKSSPIHPLRPSLGGRQERLWWILRWTFWRWKGDSVSALILVSYRSTYPKTCDWPQESVCGGPCVAPLAGWRCPGPYCGRPPFEMRLLWEQEGGVVSSRPLALYWGCPRVGCQGLVTELSLCSGLGSKLQFTDGTQAAILPLLLWECLLQSWDSQWVVGGCWCPSGQ